MKFSEVQSHLEKGFSIRRACWNESPHKAFFVPQIKTVVVVDINNRIILNSLLDCQIMANDWEKLVDGSPET